MWNSIRGKVRNYSSKTARKWKSVVGLEIHAQIMSETKLFSPSPTHSAPVNSNVSFLDASIPGTLPVLNKRCVEAGVLTSLALNCNMNMVSTFDRKHYFYGDMPTGYQITQQRKPLAINGVLNFYVFTPGIHKNPFEKSVKIKQIQLEQDSGKSLHSEDHSLVDLNRAGVGLMEIVFEPELTDGEEAAALVKELAGILRRIQTCSCKMEEGALRIDANVSINREGEGLGVRTEIKNIGSIRGVASAVKFEIERQIKLKENGFEVINETRSWDANSKSTVAMRDKEEKQDYRYMPEPNLPPLYLSNEYIGQGEINVDIVKKSIPELPAETRKRLHEELGLPVDLVVILVNNDSLLAIFEESMKIRQLNPKVLSSILIFELSNVVNQMNIDLDNFLHRSSFVAETAYLVETRVINRNTAKLLLQELVEGNPESPQQIVEARNLSQIIAVEELTRICQEVMNDNDNLVKLYRKGKTKVFKVFMGAIASRTNNRADMAKCAEIMKQLLNE